MMKLKSIATALVTMLVVLAFTPAVTLAAFVSGSTGADGDFSPTTNTVLQIPPSGVFNFGAVNIPSGVTVTFTKNTQNTPVTILATGDVTINGTISVNGSNANNLIPGVGGPGGFTGGQGGAGNNIGKRGEGPGCGGGGGACLVANYGAAGGGGGGFGASGSAGDGNYNGWGSSAGAAGINYGNERILPLIGGSGGGGGGGNTAYAGGGGGGGGGGLLIASSGTITINGSINANGGSGVNAGGNTSGGGGGSGGSIRLIANTIAGNGSITANGGAYGGGSNSNNGGAGGVGRIRFEASTFTRTSTTSPTFSLSYPYAVTPSNMPTLSITSIGGINAPSIPGGSFGAPDLMLPYNTQNPINIVVAGINIPLGTTVTIKANPAVGSSATSTATLTGNDASSTTASVSLNISTAYPSIITASVTYQLTAANDGPIYAEGERVDKIRVAANVGGRSTVTYITASGKEIPAVM